MRARRMESGNIDANLLDAKVIRSMADGKVDASGLLKGANQLSELSSRAW